MPKYAVFFTLKGETIKAWMERPSDRAAVLGRLAEEFGGTLEAYYLMFGQYDGMAIMELPDSKAAASVSLAVSSTGALGHLETHELLPPEGMDELLARAKSTSYTPPGA